MHVSKLNKKFLCSVKSHETKENSASFWKARGGFKENGHYLVVLPGLSAGIKLEEKPEL